MEVKFGPNSVDETNLLYKLQHKVKVFNTKDPLQNRGYNLVASSSKYGIVFIGVPDGILSVYYLNQLINKDCEPQHMVVKLQEKSTHIAVSCDQELLAVIGTHLLCVYRIVNFQNQDVTPSLSLKTEVAPSNFVSAMLWNPCIPDSLAIAFYDGTLIAYQLSTIQVKKVQSKARCICWSPKGKQLVTGNSDGTLCQYKPDLSLVKIIPAPNLFENSPVEALALYWISTFQFAVVYKNAADNSRPAVAIVNASKSGQLACLNYEDVCFSMGNNRPWYYYLQGLAQWNLILASSSNSMEIATFGSTDGVNWVQWCQTDEGRPELPLTDKKLENYPVGLCIDTCALHQLPWGENDVLPHMPLLLVVSQTGLLTIFNIVNMNKQAPQICSPPQQLLLPAAALTSILPDDTPSHPEVSTVQATFTQPKAQASLVQEIPPQIQPIQTTGNGNLSTNTVNSQNFQRQEISSGFSTASANQIPLQKEIKPVVPQSQPLVQEKPPSVVQTSNLKQVQENAALKAEQERLNKIKANQELKDMLVKEVNNFQMDLYKFMLKTQETQAKLQRDIESINANFSLNLMDAEQLRKECSLDDLRTAVVQLKLELVRACALVAEARTHADAKDHHQWTQADPLTTKRVASVKKLAYYVQTQLDQAQKALNFKWNELESKDQQFNKPGRRMIRPRLDDVYQPLVKQQEILSRQQAVLRTLSNTLKDCEYAPVFKSTSLLRSTPFRNKDPLSKLTKNILNMSIEPQKKGRETLLTPQKVDALRDMLSNHRIVKIKPVNVELRQHLATIRQNYEKSIEEKSTSQVYVEQTSSENELQALTPEPKWMPPLMKEVEPVIEVQKPVPSVMPAFTPVISNKPVSSFGNVARTLFADETKQEIAKPQVQPVIQVQQQQTKPTQTFSFAPFNSTTASAATRSVLKDLLQNKSQANAVETKNNSSTFMGQKICSPSSFSNKGTPVEAPATSNIFTAKPISDINNMFNKFQPQTFLPETKQAPLTPKSNETGEPEGNQVVKHIEVKKVEKPVAQALPFSSPSNVPDVLKSHQQDLPKTDNKTTLKVLEKNDKTKENIPEGIKDIPKSVFDMRESVAKPLSVLPTTRSNLTIFNTNQNVSGNHFSIPSSNSRQAEETKIQNAVQRENESVKPTIPKASSIFAAANLSVPTVPSTHSIVAPVAISPVLPKLAPEIVTKTTVSDTPFKSSEPEQVIKSPTVPDTTAPKSSEPKLVMKSSTVTDITSPKSSESELIMKSPTVSDTIASKSPASDTVINPSSSSIFAVTSEPKPTLPTEPLSSTQVPISNSVLSEATPSESSKPSVFRTPTPALSTSVFGTVTAQPNVSVFESNIQTSAFTTPTTTTTPAIDKDSKNEASIFNTATSSMFGPATQSSIFGGSVTTNTSTATAASIFASATTTTQSIFGTTPTTQSSLFGGSAGQTSVFGTNATKNQSIFGTTATQASVFGTTTPATQSSVFGAPAQTTQTSLFGTPTQTTQSSVFGSPTSTTQPSVFGTPTQTTQSSGFGSSTSTTQPSVFGTPTQTTQSSVFGSPTSTTQPSVFGTPTQTTQSSIFGTPTQTTQSSIFGTANSQVSVFGTPTPTTQSSLFGAPTTNAQSGSIFGGAEANMFASASISTTNASQNISGSIFGGSASSGSVFGNNKTNVFGGKTTFGQPNTTAASIFGGGTSFAQKPAANSFWAGANANAGAGFGSSTFGQQATTQASSIFGGSTGGSFSSPQPTGQPFGSPQQNTAFGGGENKPSVFSSPQQSGSSFGGSAVFGGKSVFGQPASFSSPPGGGFSSFGGFNKSPTSGFGAPATFGGSPTFGGSAFGGSPPGGVFGGTSPTQSFSQTQSNATFESLATQNTLTFGNLAQQSGQQPQQTPAFNQSPLFTGWRG